MQERVKVAATQISPVFMDKNATLDKTCKYISEAGRNDAELAVFPETFIPGYAYWRGILPISRWTELMVEYQKNSLVIPSRDTDVLCDAAKDAGVNCVIGCSELDNHMGGGTLYNTMLFIGKDGHILGKHRKLMPTHGERMVWGLGDGSGLRVFDMGIGMVGGLVCYENHMVLARAVMAAKGEEIHCAVWPGWWVMEKHPGAKKRYQSGKDSPHLCDIEYAVREYAFETQNFVISVSQYIPSEALPDECRDFNMAAGGSFIVNPAGLSLVEPVFGEEKLIYAVLDADERRATKAYFDAMGHYARWDTVRLDLRDEMLTPMVSRAEARKEVKLDDGSLKRLAEKYGIEVDRLIKIIEELNKLATYSKENL